MEVTDLQSADSASLAPAATALLGASAAGPSSTAGHVDHRPGQVRGHGDEDDNDYETASEDGSGNEDDADHPDPAATRQPQLLGLEGGPADQELAAVATHQPHLRAAEEVGDQAAAAPEPHSAAARPLSSASVPHATSHQVQNMENQDVAEDARLRQSSRPQLCGGACILPPLKVLLFFTPSSSV